MNSSLTPDLTDKALPVESAAEEDVLRSRDVELVLTPSTRMGSVLVGGWILSQAIQDIALAPFSGVLRTLLGLALLHRGLSRNADRDQSGIAFSGLAGFYFLAEMVQSALYGGLSFFTLLWSYLAFSCLRSAWQLSQVPRELRSLGLLDVLEATGELSEVSAKGGPQDSASRRLYHGGCGSFLLLSGMGSTILYLQVGAVGEVVSSLFFVLLGGLYLWKSLTGRTHQIQVREEPQALEEGPGGDAPL